MLFAHKDHGFHHAPAHQKEEMAKAGWEPCDDVAAFKARVWGIGAAPSVADPVVEEDKPKRKWTRRKVEQ